MHGRIGILVVLAALGTCRLAVAQDDLAKKVARYAEIMADKGPEASWALAGKLRALGPEVVEALKPHLEKGNLPFRIAAASTFIHYGDKKRGIEILLAIAGREESEREARRIAIRILGRQGDRTAGAELNRLMDETLDPELKLEMAKALWLVSLNHRPEAKKILRGYLKSDDPDLRAAGALALAEFDDFEKAKKVLEELKDEPTPRGRLARSYLRTMDSVRQLEDLFYRNPGYASHGAKFDLLDEILRYIKQYHLTGDRRTEEELLEAAARSVLRALDPSSTYLTAEQRSEHDSGRHVGLSDVGAVVGFDRRAVFTIVRVLPSSPAFSAGLRTNDKIVAVNGWSTFDRDRTEVLRRLNGPAGTRVKIKVIRRGWKEPRTIELERVRPTVCPVRGEMLPGRIGYLQVACLAAETLSLLDETLGRLKAEGMRGLIIDLRDNQGDDLDAAVGVADRFLGRGKLIVYWQGRKKVIVPRQEMRTATDAPDQDFPLVILTNERTASAAEVTAGALGFYKRATLVGRRTLGRGSVQKIFDLISKQGDRFTDEARTNGRYDNGEPYTDQNRNDRYDPGEPFEDQPRKNGVRDEGELFKDLNRDGQRGPEEPYTDTNQNGKYDGPEPFEDLNKNGRYDIGPAVKITIGRYFLPDGAAIQREVDSEGNVVNEGGVVPNVEADLQEWPGWKEEELSKLLETRKFQHYIARHWDKNREVFARLAVFDGGDPSRYPKFETFFQSLQTHLERDDVRRWLRVFVRRKVAQSGGRQFSSVHSLGDFQEDRQLQQAIREVAGRLDPPMDLKSVPEYAGFEEKAEKEKAEKEKKEEEEKAREKEESGEKKKGGG